MQEHALIYNLRFKKLQQMGNLTCVDILLLSGYLPTSCQCFDVERIMSSTLSPIPSSTRKGHDSSKGSSSKPK